MLQIVQTSAMYLPFLAGFLITVVATPITLIYIKRLGLFDDPKTHKHPGIIHKVPIPRGGGIPLCIGVVLAGVLFLPINQITVALFIAALLALTIGVLDDKYDISPYLRFGINIVTALIVVASGIGISFVTNPLGGILHLNAVTITVFQTALSFDISQVIAIFWIVWVMNMLNWSKGVDGQMPGIVAISALVIGLLSLRFPITEQNTYIAAVLSFILAGSALGFLVYNFYPAKIFPGYGATAIYLLLAVVSILSTAKLATAIIVLGVPMIDGMFTISRRIISGHSPFRHDKKHLHHLLLKLGFGQRTIALFYWVVSAILGLISLTLSSKGKLFAIIMILIVVGGVLLLLHRVTGRDDEEKSA